MTDKQRTNRAFVRSLSNTGVDGALKRAQRKSCNVIETPAEAMLRIAMRTLRHIASTPRNKGAKRNTSATLRFIETHMSNMK